MRYLEKAQLEVECVVLVLELERKAAKVHAIGVLNEHAKHSVLGDFILSEPLLDVAYATLVLLRDEAAPFLCPVGHCFTPNSVLVELAGTRLLPRIRNLDFQETISQCDELYPRSY